MEQRELGRTGEKLSVIGFGGIIVMNATPEDASRYVGEAIDGGITYFDVAPSYGNAEERLGPALEPYRDNVFLACKTGKRDKDGAALELRQSLGRLQTDHLDLYQMHALTTDEDIAQAFGPGGAIEEFVEAKRLGLVRHLGFSAHSETAALAAMERFDFDSVLFPFNYLAFTKGSFGPKVIAEAERRGVGRLALKGLALGRMKEGEQKPFAKCWYYPINNFELARASLRWTLSQPITAAVTPGHIELMRLALGVAADLATPSEAELASLVTALGDRAPIFNV